MPLSLRGDGGTGGRGVGAAAACGVPLFSQRSRPRESSWNQRQPISEQRCRLNSIRCPCAPLPPGGRVWLCPDPAERQVRPACLRPASGRICCRDPTLTPTTKAWRSENSLPRGLDPWLACHQVTGWRLTNYLKLSKQVSFLI